MKLAIASGKGGTGKTTVAVNLAWCAPGPALLLDCDVEEPNCHIFFDSEGKEQEAVSIPVPALDETKCISCGTCSRICEFHAIAFLGDRPLIFPDLCHGCGGCIWACPSGALAEVPLEIGKLVISRIEPGRLAEGRLKIGRAISPPLIKAVRRVCSVEELTIIDGPPGTACPLAAALTGADFAILVAEPTRFGLNDLEMLVERVRALAVPFGVVINRTSGRNDIVRSYCARQGITILGELPESELIARAQGRGHVACKAFSELRPLFEDLWTRIRRFVPTG